jgi:c-di-GMP-binding flagellar brake protein YcgR
MGIFDFLKKKKSVSSDKPAFVEQRFLPRWDIYTKAKLRCEGQREYIECEVKDLNLKGFSVVIPQALSRECMRATLYFNENYFFDIDLAVVWHKESEGKQVYGIRFTRIRDTDREKLIRMMRQNFPRYFEKNL